jgi:radical SAM superfamily enzyme YgiQ (UPF0313 family)
VEAFDHEDTPFDKVVDALKVQRNLSINPIFQVCFAFMDTPSRGLRLPGLELILEPSHNRSAKFDLTAVVVPPLEQEGETGTLIEWEYNIDLYDEATIDKIAIHYNHLLRQAVKNPDKQISELRMSENKKRSTQRIEENINVTITAPRPYIKNFDRLPMLNRSLVNYEKYHGSIGMAMAKHTMTLQATRGCPYRCAYCHKIWPKTHVRRSAENIFSEMKMLYDVGVRRFVFIDDIFNLDIKNCSRLFHLIIKNRLKAQIFFPNGLRGDILTPGLIDLMVEAGTVDFDFSLESASPRIQKLIRKDLNLDRFKENVDYLVRHHPHVILELQTMLGFPGETEAEAMMTLDFIKNIKWIDFPYVNLLKIFPGTDMEAIALGNGIPGEAIERTTTLGYHEYSETMSFSLEFVKHFQAKFFNEYFLSKERFLSVLPKQLKLVTPNELVQKYDSFFPAKIESFSRLLDIVGVSEKELELTDADFQDDDYMAIPGINKKLKGIFPSKQPDKETLRVLLLDLSVYFSPGADRVYDVVEVPLGLMYLLTYLDEQYGSKVNGKIAKARIDFDSHEELYSLVTGFNPGIIGIRTLSYYKNFFHETVFMIRQWGIDVPIAAGGPYASGSYREVLEDSNVDLAVLGEGELTLCEIIGKMLENNGKLPEDNVLATINGIAFVENRREALQEKIEQEKTRMENLKVQFNF